MRNHTLSSYNIIKSWIIILSEIRMNLLESQDRTIVFAGVFCSLPRNSRNLIHEAIQLRNFQLLSDTESISTLITLQTVQSHAPALSHCPASLAFYCFKNRLLSSSLFMNLPFSEFGKTGSCIMGHLLKIEAK